MGNFMLSEGVDTVLKQRGGKRFMISIMTGTIFPMSLTRVSKLFGIKCQVDCRIACTRIFILQHQQNSADACGWLWIRQLGEERGPKRLLPHIHREWKCCTNNHRFPINYGYGFNIKYTPV